MNPNGVHFKSFKTSSLRKNNDKLRCGPWEFRTCASWDQRGEVSTQAAAKLTGLMMWEGSGRPTGDYGIYVDLSRHNSAGHLIWVSLLASGFWGQPQASGRFFYFRAGLAWEPPPPFGSPPAWGGSLPPSTVSGASETFLDVTCSERRIAWLGK